MGLKGQISIEFMAAFFLYLLAVVVLFQTVSGQVPDYQDSLDQKPLHYEAKYVSDQVLTKSGYHTFGAEGTNWEENTSTMGAMTNFGLAKDYLVIDRGKLENISTVGNSVINYTTFRETLGVDNQYRFNFVLKPVVPTDMTFERNSSSPPVTEPDTDLYSSAGPEVKYGTVRLGGQTVHFLVTSHRSSYNTTYVSENDNFDEGEEPLGTNEEFRVSGRNYTLEDIQNRKYERGGLITLSRQIKEFGAQRDQTKETIKMNRYVTFKAEGSEKQPMLVEVYAW